MLYANLHLGDTERTHARKLFFCYIVGACFHRKTDDATSGAFIYRQQFDKSFLAFLDLCLRVEIIARAKYLSDKLFLIFRMIKTPRAADDNDLQLVGGMPVHRKCAESLVGLLIRVKFIAQCPRRRRLF